MFNCVLSLFVSIQVSDAHVGVLCIVVFCSSLVLILILGVYISKNRNIEQKAKHETTYPLHNIILKILKKTKI